MDRPRSNTRLRAMNQWGERSRDSSPLRARPKRNGDDALFLSVNFVCTQCFPDQDSTKLSAQPQSYRTCRGKRRREKKSFAKLQIAKLKLGSSKNNEGFGFVFLVMKDSETRRRLQQSKTETINCQYAPDTTTIFCFMSSDARNDILGTS